MRVPDELHEGCGSHRPGQAVHRYLGGLLLPVSKSLETSSSWRYRDPWCGISHHDRRRSL